MGSVAEGLQDPAKSHFAVIGSEMIPRTRTSPKNRTYHLSGMYVHFAKYVQDNQAIPVVAYG